MRNAATVTEGVAHFVSYVATILLAACGGGGTMVNPLPDGGGTAGTTWITRAAGATGTITSVAHSSKRFVALTDSFGSGKVLVSNDGHSWVNPMYAGLLPDRGIAFGNDLFVAVGSVGTVSTSPDGVTWTPRSMCTRCLSVAWAKSGFVAVGETGSVVTSNDGLSWTSRSTPLGTRATFRRVATSGAVFVAVGSDGNTLKGAIVHSNDGGATWSTATVTPTSDVDFHRVVWDGTRFLATSNGIWTSTDGASWTQIATNTIYLITPAGTGYIGTNGVGAMMTSVDAITWTGPTYNFVYPAIEEILWLAERNEYLVVGGMTDSGFVATSTDASIWEARLTSDPMTGVVWDGAQFLAIDTNGRLFTSPDGVTWASQRIIPSDGVLRPHSDIAWSGSRYVVAALDRIISSTDGITWGNPFYSSLTEFVSVIWTGTEFATISDAGRFFRSADGIGWPAVGTQIAANAHLRDLAWSSKSNRFAAAAAGGNLYTSDDGTAWTSHSVAAPNDLRSIVWTGTQFVAVGDKGSVVTSTDGMDWTARSVASAPSFNAVAWANGQLVAAAGKGRIFVSSDGASWAEETTDTTLALSALAASPTRVVAMGDTGRVISRP